MQTRSARFTWCVGELALGVLATVLWVCAPASVAHAQDPTLVVVMKAPGRGGDAISASIFDELAGRDGYAVQDEDWFKARVDARGLSWDSLFDQPEELTRSTEARSEEAVDVLLRPVKGKARGSVALQIVDGSTGQVVGSVDLKLRGGKLNAKGAAAAVDEAVELMVGVGWPEPPPPEPEIEPMVDPTLEVGPVIEPEPDERPKEGPLVVLEGGFSALRRSFDVVSSTGGLEFTATFYPGLRVAADLYPYPWGGAFIGNLGLTGHFLSGSETVKLLQADGTVAEIAADHTEWSTGAVFRQEFSPTFHMRYGLGYEAVDFVLADNPVYSTTTYAALWLSAHTEIGIADGLAFAGGIRALPWVGLGESEADFGTGSTAFGAVIDLSLTYDLFAGMFLRGGYRFRAVTASFEGTGTRQVGEQTLTNAQSNDFVHNGELAVGYRY